METYFCLNCGFKGQLDPHGKCASCGSDAVVTMAANYQRTPEPKYKNTELVMKFLEALRVIEKHREEDSAILELERMWDLK